MRGSWNGVSLHEVPTHGACPHMNSTVRTQGAEKGVQTPCPSSPALMGPGGLSGPPVLWDIFLKAPVSHLLLPVPPPLPGVAGGPRALADGGQGGAGQVGVSDRPGLLGL